MLTLQQFDAAIFSQMSPIKYMYIYNELIKAVAEIFSIKMAFVFSLNTLYIYI